jgi:hypothetical protein
MLLGAQTNPARQLVRNCQLSFQSSHLQKRELTYKAATLSTESIT